MLKKIKQKIRQVIQSEALVGDTVYCPVCRRGSIAFLPYGETKRAHARCPNCHSLERQRLLWLFLERRALLGKPFSLLHVSPEKVLFKKFQQNTFIDYHPVDKFDPGYAYPKGTRNVDICEAPYESNYFDAIICIHVLEHIPDDAKAIRELYRILKPGGWAVILVPIDKNRATTFEDWSITSPAERKKHFGQPDHVRQYGMDYRNRLEAGGFTVEIDSFASEFPPEECFRLGIDREEDIYFCRK